MEEKPHKSSKTTSEPQVALPNMAKLKAKVRQRIDQKIQKIEHEIDDVIHPKKHDDGDVTEEVEGQAGASTTRRKDLAKTIADIFGDDDDDASDAEVTKDGDCETVFTSVAVSAMFNMTLVTSTLMLCLFLR